VSRRNRQRQIDSRIQEHFRQELRERLRRLRRRIFEAKEALRRAEITLDELEGAKHE